MPATNTKRDNVLNIIRWLGLIAILVVWLFSIVIHSTKTDLEPQIINEFPGSIIKLISSEPVIYSITSSEGKLIGYTAVGSGQGYSGPIQGLVITDQDGIVQIVKIIKHNEWPVWFEKLIAEDYFTKFIGRDIKQTSHEDVNAVTGATYSSNGVADAITASNRDIAEIVFGIKGVREAPKYRFGYPEFSVVMLWVLVGVSLLFDRPVFRWLNRLGSIIIIGFWLTIPITLATLTGLALGLISFHPNTFMIYILVGGALGTALFLGRNLYCQYVCPFGGVQELLSLAGFQWKIKDSQVIIIASKIKPFIVWIALMIVLLTGSPSAGSYEPFGAIFGFKGERVQWILLLVTLIMGLFIPRFWCKFGCPVNVILDNVASASSKLRRVFAKRQSVKNEK